MSKDKLLCLLLNTVKCDHVIEVISSAPHDPLVGTAEARHRLYQRVENRLEVDGGTAYDLEYVRGGGLLLEGFFEIAGLGLHLIEQLHVLECDHRLVGESPQ